MKILPGDLGAAERLQTLVPAQGLACGVQAGNASDVPSQDQCSVSLIIPYSI